MQYPLPRGLRTWLLISDGLYKDGPIIHPLTAIGPMIPFASVPDLLVQPESWFELGNPGAETICIDLAYHWPSGDCPVFCSGDDARGTPPRVIAPSFDEWFSRVLAEGGREYWLDAGFECLGDPWAEHVRRTPAPDLPDRLKDTRARSRSRWCRESGSTSGRSPQQCWESPEATSRRSSATCNTARPGSPVRERHGGRGPNHAGPVMMLDDPHAARSWLASLGMRDPERGLRDLRDLRRRGGSPESFAQTLEQLAALLPACPDPAMALTNLDRFVAAAPDGAALLKSLGENLRTTEILIQILSTSQYFSELLIRDTSSLDWLRGGAVRHDREGLIDELWKRIPDGFERRVAPVWPSGGSATWRCCASATTTSCAACRWRSRRSTFRTSPTLAWKPPAASPAGTPSSGSASRGCETAGGLGSSCSASASLAARSSTTAPTST